MKKLTNWLNNRLSLKWKIFAFLLGFCALLLLILSIFQIVLLKDTYMYIRGKEIEKAISIVEQNVNNPELGAIIRGFSENNEIFISPARPLSNNQLNQADNWVAQPPAYNQPNTQPPIPPGRNDERSRRFPVAVSKTKSILLSDGQTHTFTFNAIVSPVSATVKTLRYQLYYITGIMIVLSVLIALIIAKWVSKPIEDINKGAKALAGGKYDIHFEGEGFLEIAELSDTLNRAAVELNKAEVLRRELLANISHDMRTPLSLIYSCAEVMQDFPGEITPEQTQTIMDEAKRLATLVDDVLDISKLEAGIQKLSIEPFNLTGSLKRITERISELLKNDGYNIAFYYDYEVEIMADEIKITQAFYNLLVNAVNYTGADKLIIVSQTVTDGTVKIEVSDTGDGIGPEDLPYIWDRYYKVDKKHKRAVTGTGLGLSIVKKVIEKHGGNYGVKSEIGLGSAFWFTLNNITNITNITEREKK